VKTAIISNQEFSRFINSDGFADFIAKHFAKIIPPESIEKTLQNLINKDYRSLARDHAPTIKKPASSTANESHSLDVFFSINRDETPRFFLINKEASPPLKAFLRSGDFDSTFNECFDLPGIYRLVRRGLVKSTFLEDGTEIVIKKQNDKKKNSFISEHTAIQNLKSFGFNNASIKEISNSACKIGVKLPNYIAVVKGQKADNFYSISEKVSSPTVEEVLLATNNPKDRKKILEELSLLLQHLYSQGVLWGDFAPRNILLDQSSSHNIYTVLDFEKTKFSPSPVDINTASVHLREGVAIEEFSALSSREEVRLLFGDYFKPEAWDTLDKSPINLSHPKSDYISTINRRGNVSPSMGDYNKFELENIEIRHPFFDAKEGKTLYPLHICFKVYHYFGYVDDMKVMEILLYAKSIGCFDTCVKAFSKGLETLDDEMYKDEFLSILHKTDLTPAQDLPAGKFFLSNVYALHKLIGTETSFIDRLAHGHIKPRNEASKSP